MESQREWEKITKPAKGGCEEQLSCLSPNLAGCSAADHTVSFWHGQDDSVVALVTSEGNIGEHWTGTVAPQKSAIAAQASISNPVEDKETR